MAKCIIEQGSTVTKDGPFWIVNGNRKISEKDFSTCKWIVSRGNPSKIVVQTQESKVQHQAAVETQDFVIEAPVPQVFHNENKPSGNSTQVIENSDLNEIATLLKYAGDNIWLAALILAYVLFKKYLERKEMSDSNLKEDLSKKCSDRHSGVSSELEKIRSDVADLRSEMDSGRTDLGIRVADIEYDVKSLKKRLRSKSEKSDLDDEKDL